MITVQAKVIFRHRFDRLRSREIEGESNERRKKGDGWRRDWGVTRPNERVKLAYNRIHVYTYIQETGRQTGHAQTHILRRTSVFKHA